MSNPKNPPTILQVIPQLETGGAEQTTLDIGRALVACGWGSLVVCQGGRMMAQLESEGTKLLKLPTASKNPITMLLNAFRLAAIIRQHKVSLIHARSRAPAWSALVAARLSRIAFVTTYHGAYNQQSWLKGLYNSVMVRSDVTIANSKWTKELIQQRHPDAAEKIVVVHRGTDFSSFEASAISAPRKTVLMQQWGVENNHPIILNLARLTGWKGQRTLIVALTEIVNVHPDAMLVLAGDDQGRNSYREELEKLAASLGVADNIRMPGHCSDAAAACAVADLVVVASTEPEAFGRAAVEAQALKTPVIVTDIGAVGETVLAPDKNQDGHRTGWKVPPGKADVMAKTIISVLALGERERSKIALDARHHVLENFSVEAMSAKSIEIYTALLSR